MSKRVDMYCRNDHAETRKRKGGVYLEFGFSSSGLWVTEERDERGSESVFFVVVLGAVTVGQLDQAVVVRQTGVCFPETPRTKVAEGKQTTEIHCNGI